MPKKTNAFLCFMKEYQKKGNVSTSYPELSKMLKPLWNSMSQDDKNKYQQLADKYNGNQNRAKSNEQIINLHNNSSDYLRMKVKLTEMFQEMNANELLEKKFFLLHVNCHSHTGDQYYFPAEIAILEFNLLNGVFRTYHQIIGIYDIYPRGLAGGMRLFSDQFHQISCWDKHPSDYKRIFLDLISFLKNEECHSDLIENTLDLDLPDMFTIEEEVGNNMMMMKSSLHRLYQIAFPKHNAMESKPIFSVGSLDRLFYEIKMKLDLNFDHRNLQPGMSCHDILEFDMYGAGLGCEYHEKKEIAFKCSKSRVLQWMSNICKHINAFGSLQIIPGRHFAIQLRDGSRLIIENCDTPFTVNDLKLKIPTDENELKDDTTYNYLPCKKSSLFLKTSELDKTSETRE